MDHPQPTMVSSQEEPRYIYSGSPRASSSHNQDNKTPTGGIIMENLRQNRKRRSRNIVEENEEEDGGASEAFVNLFSHPVYVAEKYQRKYYIMRAEYIKVERRKASIKFYTKASFIRVEDELKKKICEVSNPSAFKKLFKNTTGTFPSVSNFTQATFCLRNCNESTKLVDRIKIMVRQKITDNNTGYEWVPLKDVIDEEKLCIRPSYDPNSADRKADICVAKDHSTEVAMYERYKAAHPKEEPVDEDLEEEEVYMEDEAVDDEEEIVIVDESDKDEEEEEVEPPKKKRNTVSTAQLETLVAKLMDEKVGKIFSSLEGIGKQVEEFSSSLMDISKQVERASSSLIDLDKKVDRSSSSLTDLVDKRLLLLTQAVSEMKDTMKALATQSSTNYYDKYKQASLEAIVLVEKGPDVIESLKLFIPALLHAIQKEIQQPDEEVELTATRRKLLKDGIQGNTMYFYKRSEKLLNQSSEYTKLQELLCTEADENKKQFFGGKILDYIKRNYKQFVDEFSK